MVRPLPRDKNHIHSSTSSRGLYSRNEDLAHYSDMAREIIQAVRSILTIAPFLLTIALPRSMRRKHGIPDNDHRPFNVAYAAVMRARKDEETAKRKARLEQVVLMGQEERNAPPEQGIRQRPGASLCLIVLSSKSYLGYSGAQREQLPAWTNGAVNDLPGRFNPSSDNLFASVSGSGQFQTR